MKIRSPGARLACVLATSLLPFVPAPAERPGRAELRALDTDLLAHDSATLVLDRWCERLRLADPAKVVADRVENADKPVPAEVRAQLKVEATMAIGYRRVRLRCGASILSEADNWYVPARLTAEMNRTLETSDTPFGRVVRPLDFHRRTLSHRRLHLPYPILADSPVLEHRTVLELADGTPISFVVESYRGRLLGGR
jgi:chorismate-pyruvate lyase